MGIRHVSSLRRAYSYRWFIERPVNEFDAFKVQAFETNSWLLLGEGRRESQRSALWADWCSFWSRGGSARAVVQRVAQRLGDVRGLGCFIRCYTNTAGVSHQLRDTADSEFKNWSGARDLNPGLPVPNHATVHPNMSVSAFSVRFLQVDAPGASRPARIFSRITT
jgi:hypothetical protein